MPDRRAVIRGHHPTAQSCRTDWLRPVSARLLRCRSQTRDRESDQNCCRPEALVCRHTDCVQRPSFVTPMVICAGSPASSVTGAANGRSFSSNAGSLIKKFTSGS